MIVADFSRTDKGFHVNIKGHADYCDGKQDIVCAAASGIFYALCSYLVNFKNGNYGANVVERGYADIDCTKDCENYLQMACLGFCEIARKHPRNMVVVNRAWDWRMLP